ncbi:MAG TPA: hypothetical protein VNF47_23155 [Streptosporangiaceae bacterium]|nr:hypothetical protein [Streptosporangiaceae bacterium]
MSTSVRGQSGAVRLCNAPPVPPCLVGLLFCGRWMKDQLTFVLRFRILGDAIIGKIATRGIRQRAWHDGFDFALGSGHQSWWLSMLQEHTDGNDAGVAFVLRCGALGSRRRPIGVIRGADVSPGGRR